MFSRQRVEKCPVPEINRDHRRKFLIGSNKKLYRKTDFILPDFKNSISPQVEFVNRLFVLTLGTGIIKSCRNNSDLCIGSFKIFRKSGSKFSVQNAIERPEDTR